MACHHLSGRRVSTVTTSWKLAVIIVFLSAQLGILPGAVRRVQAAPQVPAPAYAPGVKPSVTLTVPATGFIGEDVSFSVTFDNVGTTPADIGYGPFVDIILDTTGTDGNDGLGTATISASYLGTPIQAGSLFITTFDGAGHATHPFARQSDGTQIIVNGTAGYKLVSIRLPFGSFTPTQPPATIDVKVNMSDLADLNQPLSIQARGGYEFGYTPLNDWCCGDAAWPDAISSWTSKSITPTLFSILKTYSGLESEIATGPNYPRQFTLSVDIADGQTLTNLDLTDSLPANMQFVSLDSVMVHGIPVTPTPISTPSNFAPGGTLTRRISSVTGTTSTADATMTFTFYIPRDDATSSRVIDPTTGTAVVSCNNASVSGSWAPIDPRDPVGTQTINPAGCEYSLTARSLAIQKGITVVYPTGTGSGRDQPKPGSTLEYTLNVQVSDFFAYDGMVITDTLSDGQHFDPSFPPTLLVNGNYFSLPAAAFQSANYTVDVSKIGNDPNPATNGSTTITFRLSDEVISRAAEAADPTAHAHALLGQVIGGCIPLTGSAAPDCGTYNDLGTTASIVFRTTILHDFTDTYPSGDTSVDQGDVLNNGVTASGNLLDTSSFASQAKSVTDGSAATLTIGRQSLAKNIFAINNSTDLTPYLDPLGSGKLLIKPGDTVTFELTYGLLTSDVENLTLADYLPLPVYHVSDYSWSFSKAGGIPAPGMVTLGPSDDFYAYMVSGSGSTGLLTGSTLHPSVSIDPVVIADGTNNSITVAYADYNDTRDLSRTVDLLFTATVSADPFADRLFLTNEAHAYEGSTNGAPSTASALVQFILTEPVLVSKKSVIWTDNANAVFNPADSGNSHLPDSPVTFLPPASTPRWSGTINSTNLVAHPINSDLSGVDAGDTVSFALTIQNTGSSLKGAYDLRLQDSLPAGFQIPTASPGMNLQIFYGDGTGPIAYTSLATAGLCTGFGSLNDPCGPDDVAGNADDLFGAGLELVDPTSGAYGGLGVCQAHDPNNTNDIILLTYDAQLKDTVAPGNQVNTGSLIHYAGKEGGPTDLPQPQADTATVTVNTSLAKTLLGTEITNATNSATQAVIGELATYQLVVTIPEGTVPAAQIVDTLDSGLAFVDLTSVIVSNPVDGGVPGDRGVTSSVMAFDPATGACTNCAAGINPQITSSGRVVTFDLGNLTNTDRNNAVAETITITYRAVVLNRVGNQAGTLLNNSAAYSWAGGSQPAVSAPNVTVIEPNVDITKTVSPTSGDAADSFTYTITITGATITDAFDVTLDDSIPAQMTGLSLLSVTDTAGIVHLANFQLIGNTLTTLTPFNMPVNPSGRTIVLTLTGSVSYSVNPQQNVDNNAIVRWTSLPGPVSGRSAYDDSSESSERTGADGVGGALNDYAKVGLGRFTVTSVGATKIFITTSEAHTPDSPPPPQVAIGEIVRYRLVVPVPESTSPNFQVLDNLPTGMTFLNDNTATVAFVTNGPGITSTGIGIIPAIPHNPCTVSGATVNATTPADPLPCSFAPGNVGSDSSTSADADAYTTGTDVYFKFGNLVNNDNDPDTEFVALEFNALVDNNPAGGNLAGKNLDNSFNVYVNGGVNGPTSNSIRVRVVEPAISMTKIANPTTGDAGDTINYSLAVSNTGTTTAFDVQVTDSAPVGITADMAGLTVSDPGSCTVGMDKSHSSGNTADVRFTSIPAGCTLTISYTATVDYTVTASQVLTNTAHIGYSSLPGPNGTISNPTGSSTPGASGTNTGERVYTGQSSATFTINPVVPVKSIVATSNSDTPGNDLAIGEVLRYRLAVDIPEGTQLAFTIDDILPAGFTYIGNPMISFIDDSGMTLSSDLAGSAQADNNALPPTFPLPSARVSNVGQHYTFTLGDIVNHDSDPGAESAVLEFDVRVNNDATNNNTNTKANNFTVTIANQLRGTSNTVTATIVEPVLTVNKTIAHIDLTRDAGDTVTYQVSIAPDLRSIPGSTAYAYDIHYTDTLPGDLTFTPGSLAVTLNGGAATPTDHSSGNLVDITVGTIPNTGGTSVVLTFSATLNISVTPGELITNTADLTWTSLAGPDANERTGSLVPAFNDYHAQSSASFNVHDPAFSKSLMFSSEGSTADPNLTIGEVATFALKVTLPEGTTPALHIRDDIPLGLQVVPGSAAIITSVAGSYGLLMEDFNGTLSSMGATITPPGGSGDDISFDFTNPITVAVDAVPDLNNNSFLISFQAVVNNVIGNHSGISLPNSATMTVGSWSSGPSVASVLVVEPKLLIQKTVDNNHPRLGDTITYTATVQYDPASTADAFNLVITDTLPAGLLAPFHLTATSPSNCAGTADTSHSAGASVDMRVAHLPPACILTITYQSGIDTTPSNTPPIGTVLTNATHLTWTSLPVVTADVRTGSGGSPNTYFANSSVPVTFANIDMVIGKSDGGATAIPGGLIPYVLHYQNAGNITATGVVLTDVIPPNTTFHAAGSNPSWSCADGAAAGTSCTFGIASIPAATSGDVLVVLQVVATVPDQVTSIVNTATISDDHTNGAEPTPLNNTSTDTTPLNATPDIAVTKTDGLDIVAPGESLPYVLTISNHGNQDAAGVAVTDTIPAHTTFVSAGDNPDGQAASFNSGTGVVSWPVFHLAAGHSISLTVSVTVDTLLPAGVSMLTNTAQAQDDGTNGPDSTPADNTATDVDQIIYIANSDLTKTLVVDSLGATVNPDATIGEVMTYHITFNVPPGWMNDLTLTDRLDLGLAFLDCESITPSSSSLTWQDPPAAEATDFSPICTSPAVSAVGDPVNLASPGRQVVFNFHNLHNGDNQTHSITVSVHAVVLDVVENISGRNDLNNAVVLDWNGGSLTTSAQTPLQIVEPKLTLQKAGDKNTTAPGDVITFTLTVAHDMTASTADAYDVLLTDTLPNGLTYVPASLKYVSGNMPNSATPPSLDDTSAPTLRVHWDTFPSAPTGQAVIQFQAILGNIGPGNSVTNSANVEWTSLPGIPPSPAHVPPLPAGQESIYNDAAHERRYDPLHPADVYSVSAAFQVSMPKLPLTGFAPERTTLLPDQPADALYSDLGTLWLEIPSLGVKARIVGVPASSGAWDLTWLGDQIGYLYGTSYPTWSGNTGLTGHVYLPNGKPGPFVNLHTMTWGQQIIVHLAGQQYVFEVRSVRLVLPDDLSVLGHAATPTLTLITCRGYDQTENDYLYRVAVQAVLVQILPDK